MRLRLAVSNRLRDTMGDNYQCVFTENGGTIGRAAHNEWILPDEKRYVSSVHASIECRDGRFFLVDTSMNGTFVNGNKKALGPTAPAELKMGMKLRMGNYHIMVAEIGQLAESQAETLMGAHLLEDDAISIRDDLLDRTRQQEDAPQATSGFGDLASINQELSQELLIEDDIAEKLDLESLLDDRIASVNKSMMTNFDNLSSGPASGSQSLPVSSATETIAVERTASHTPNVTQMPGTAIPPTEKNFRALIEGLGIDRGELETRAPEEIARAVGGALREAVIALKKMRKDRATSKHDLSMPASQQDIDDLTDSNVNEDIVDLLLGRGQVHQQAATNMKAGLTAVRQHNAAMRKAAQDALNAFLDQIAPEELAERFAATKGGKGFFKSSRNASLWEQFEQFYEVIAARQPDALPEFIKQEYERAYLANLRTLERSDD
ncbi:MAG: type VI secretion system-associated FHA domain protein TagH [Pseudomonadota bacterium]